MRRQALRALAFALGLTGCLDVTPPDGVLFCGAQLDCPASFSCVNMRCRRGAGLDSGTDAGTSDGGMLDGGMLDVGTTDTGTLDGGTVEGGASDVGTLDGGPVGLDATGPCTLLPQSGCAGGQRCVPDTMVGGTHCVRPGTIAIDLPCTRSADGSDECVAGAWCIDSRCAAFCEPTASSCATASACSDFSLGSTQIHACVPTCNPVTQTCTGTNGCYGSIDGPFTCAHAGDATHTQGHVITDTVYVNSCAPGFNAYFLNLNNASMPICSAYCTPGESYIGYTANIDGIGPHTCAARGATGTECRYLGVFQDTWNALGNTVGVCITPRTSLPSCATLTNTDTDGDRVPQNIQFGCGPQTL